MRRRELRGERPRDVRCATRDTHAVAPRPHRASHHCETHRRRHTQKNKNNALLSVHSLFRGAPHDRTTDNKPLCKYNQPAARRLWRRGSCRTGGGAHWSCRSWRSKPCAVSIPGHVPGVTGLGPPDAGRRRRPSSLCVPFRYHRCCRAPQGGYGTASHHPPPLRRARALPRTSRLNR